MVGTGENAAGPVVENRRGRGLIDDVYISKFVNNEPTFLLTNITSIYMNPIFSGFEWEIKDIQCCGGLEIDQGYVENDKYTTVQAEPREGGIRLDITNKQFNAGDILEYDVDYNSLSGNAMSRIVINGQRLDDLICCWRGAIGYWDQDMSFGNQVGTYHVKINFLGNDVLIDVTRPNGGTIVSESVSLPAPYTFGFETRTGANGACNFTYHNFIYDKQSPQWSDAIPGLNTTPIIQYAPNQDYTFNITWIDNAQVNEVSFTFNDTIYNFSEGEIIKTGDMYSIILTDLSAGDYYYEWYGRDVSGNWNSTGIWTFDLQKGAIIPDLSIVPLSPIMYGTETTATCISNNPEQTVKLMRNGADVDATENGVSVILSSGEHDYECHAEQTQNYTGTGCGMDDYTVLDFATNSYGVDLVRNIHKQTVGKDEIATYLLNITNLGDVQDTFDLIIDKNPRDATVILNTTTIMLGINQTEYIEMKISSSEIGANSVWIKATSQSDVNVSDSVQTVTIVKGNENSNIDDDNVIEDSAIESSTINSSTINQTFVNSSLIIGSTITNTEIISSNVSNTNLNGIILINADVKNNNINSGNITINNLEFKITEEQTINDIISKRIEESLINADKDEEKEFGVGVKVNIMPNKRYSGGSLEITEHIIPSKGASKVSNSLNYFTIESSTNIVDAMIKSIVKIPYLNKENLKVRYYNEASGQWEDVAITISNNYISFETTHFSEYVLSGTEIIVEETPASVSLGGGGGGGIGIPDDEDEIKDEENDIEEENNDINSEDTDDKITEETVGSGITGMILGDTDITTLGIAIIVLIGLGGIFYYFKKFKPKFKKIKFNIKKR